MATRKAKPKAKAARKGSKTTKTSPSKVAGIDLGKYLEDIKIGKYSWDDISRSGSKNMSAIADANRAILDGYTEIARRQYEMLKGLLRELRKVKGDRDTVVKELKRVMARARRDMQTLRTMASRTNSKAQRIVKRRAEVNIKAWTKLVADARTSMNKNRSAPAAPAAGKKAPPKKKVAARKKAGSGKKPAPKRKAAAR